LDDQFDLIVIGGGPGGYVAAIKGAQQGLRVALVEEGELGGTCLNRGCIPTKTLMHAAFLYQEVKEAEELGIYTEGLRCDRSTLYQRKDTVVQELREGVSGLLQANGVECYKGRAYLSAADTLVLSGIEEVTLHASRMLLAVGAKPQRPPIPGMELPGVLTSDEILASPLTACQHLAILGGGVIGCELASVYGALGCEVTILEAAERILPLADREISQNLTMILKKRGISIRTGCLVETIKPTVDGLSLIGNDKAGTCTIACDHLLVSIGRKANCEGLWNPSLGIETAAGGIVVNAQFETSVPGIYAIGDCVAGSQQLAHVASAQADHVVAGMMGKQPEKNLAYVPSCLYTNPEIAWVGLSAEEAKKQGFEVKTSKYLMSGNGKSLLERQERGFIKLVVDAKSETLLGAQLMCGRATELIAGMASAIACACQVGDLASVIYPHPSFSEGLGEALEDLFGRAVHVAPKRKRN